MLKSILIVGTGGFIGTASRFLVTRYFQNNVLSVFPYSTLIVNILGCLLVGIFFGLSEKYNFISHDWRLFLTVGFCGGFTTFSAFANENFLMLKNNEFFYFALYTSLSIILGLVATYIGSILSRII